MKRVLICIIFFNFIFTDIFIQVVGAEQVPMLSKPKKMTMVFTRSTDEYSGRWTYLVFAEALKRMGIELVFETYPPKRGSFLTDEGEVDGDLGRIYSYDKTHPNLIRVEEPLTTVSWIAYTLDPTIKVDGWESLKSTNYKVEYRKGLAKSKTRLSALVRKENLSSVGNVSSGLRKLVAGRTDIYVDVEETVLPFLSSEEFKSSKIRKAGVMDEETLHAFLHKKNKSYVIALSAVLRHMKESGLFEAYQEVVKREIGATSVLSKLMNGGFEKLKEDKLNYWKLFGPEESFLVDTDFSVEGKQSMQIYLKQNSRRGSRLTQDIEVEAGKRYDFGGKIKANLEEGFAIIMVIFLDKKGDEIKTYSLPKVAEHSGWIYQNSWIKSPNGADVAKIICLLKGKGKVWFDDIHFTTKIRGGY